MLIRLIVIWFLGAVLLPNIATAGETATAAEVESQIHDTIDWVDYANGTAVARAENKPMLVFFYRDSCPYCRKLNQGAMTDTALVQYLNEKFVPIRVNTESRKPVVLDSLQITEAQLANENWQIRGVPAMWLLEPDGCRIKKLVGLKACSDVLISLREVAEHLYGDCPDLPLAKPRTTSPDTAKTAH